MDDQETLASELLRELKATNKRIFVALVIVLVGWLLTIGIFFWYFSLPIDETYVDQAVEGDANTMVGIGDSYGELSEDYETETSDTSS